MSVTSYPSIFTVGHKAARTLWDDPERLLEVTEKVDGSQFSCHVTTDGVLKFRSKGALIDTFAPPKMFARAVATFVRLHDEGRLASGFTYRGEVLDKPKHNTLAYPRVPTGHVILFDIMMGEEDYCPYESMSMIGTGLGLEVVPLLWHGPARDLAPQRLRELLAHRSILGDVEIEGIVVKPANRDVFGVDKKLLVAKLVNEAFKEEHGKTWKGEHEPAAGQKQEVLTQLGSQYGTVQRWQKAVQHLRDSGGLELEPKDIPLLLREVVADIEKEHETDIKEALYRWAKKDLARSWVRGLPEWYKQWLVQDAAEQQHGNEHKP